MIGKMIRHYRTVRALSVKNLAKQLGVTEITIYLWETGQRKPKLDNVQAMAKIFKIKVEELTQYL